MSGKRNFFMQSVGHAELYCTDDDLDPSGSDPWRGLGKRKRYPKEWCERMAKIEGDAEIGAGPVARDPVFEDEEAR